MMIYSLLMDSRGVQLGTHILRLVIGLEKQEIVLVVYLL